MSYTVIAPLVLAVDEEGHTHHVYQGGVITWLSRPQAEHFLAEGLVVDTDDLPAELIVDDGDDKPLRSAPKVSWVAYAVSKGADEAEAEQLNKTELIELYGG